jgi:hypothetical protein
MREKTTPVLLQEALIQALYDDRKFLVYLIEMALLENEQTERAETLPRAALAQASIYRRPAGAREARFAQA